MSTKIKTNGFTSPSFHKQLKSVLKNYYDPQQIGESSPLADPYFLGTALTCNRPTPLLLGQTLCQEIQKAQDTLWGISSLPTRKQLEETLHEIRQHTDSPQYAYMVLDLKYFHRYFKPRHTSEIYDDFLCVSQSGFYRSLDEAIEQLGQVLLQQLHPTFRLEQPILQSNLVGRTDVLTKCLAQLQAGKIVALTGPGGIGKTALGTAIAMRWPTKAVFWFTLHPTLNDHLSSLLFSFGRFLHQWGASNLWRKIVAKRGQFEDLNLALGLIREDLETLSDTGILLCFDELDRLYCVTGASQRHIQILEFLESLRGQAPILMLGQRATIDTDFHHTLDGLTCPQICQFLDEAALPYSPEEVTALFHYTGGNARLLQVCVALAQKGETLTDILTLLPQSPALQPLLNRLWLRLTPQEQHLLQALAVFRSPVPASAWSAQQTSLDNLLERGILQRDQQTGITLRPALRDLIYTELPGELRDHFHLEGAALRATYGDYTAAAYHYWRAGYDKEAVQIWYPHHSQEIERGQAEAALHIFQQMSLRRLGKEEHQSLILLRSELRKLRGEPEKGQQEIENYAWPTAHETTIQARLLQGDFLAALGYPYKAVETYEEGINVAARIAAQVVKLHNRKSVIHLRQREMHQAWREARLVQYEAKHLQGTVEEHQGRFNDAYCSYQQALALAQSLEHGPGIARTHRSLATLLGRQTRFDESVDHLEKAIAYYKQIDDRFNMEITRSHLSATYLQAKRFAASREAAEKSLSFFERMQASYWIATTASNLAEACLELGDLEKAQEYAHYVLQQEEPFTYPFGLYTLGLVHHKQANLDEAVDILEMCVTAAQQNSDKYMEAYASRALGRVYLDVYHSDGAKVLESALQLFEELGLKAEVQETADLLTTLLQPAFG